MTPSLKIQFKYFLICWSCYSAAFFFFLFQDEQRLFHWSSSPQTSLVHHVHRMAKSKFDPVKSRAWWYTSRGTGQAQRVSKKENQNSWISWLGSPYMKLVYLNKYYSFFCVKKGLKSIGLVCIQIIWMWNDPFMLNWLCEKALYGHFSEVK